MAITRATDLANIGSGIGTNPAQSINLGIAVTIGGNSGVISATSFIGSGAGLTGISSVSFATNSFGLLGNPSITVGDIIADGGTFSDNVNFFNNTITSGIATATTFSGNITGTAATFTGNVSIAGISTLGIATATAFGVSGFSTFAGTSDFRGAIETVATGATSTISGTTRVTLECDLANGNVFTHNCLATSADVGIVSLRNFPVTKNSVTTYTIIFTQNATGTANTTANTGIGTRITLTPLGVTGFTTSARVSTASTVTLSTTANDVEIVTLAIHYNGSGTGTPGNYRVFATNSTGYRFGTIGF